MRTADKSPLRNMVRVLGLARYPNEAAATRFRLTQLVGPLAEHGVEMRIRTFLDAPTFSTFYQRSAWPRTVRGLAHGGIRALTDLTLAPRPDVLVVQREAVPFGPPIIERLAMRRGRCAMVLDLDDATYLSSGDSVYGSLGRLRSWPRKADTLIRLATVVTCGNHVIADYVAAAGKEAVIVPTVVDTALFTPKEPERPAETPVLGWIGSHSTFPYLESILPILAELALTRRFRLKVVGSGREEVAVPGVDVETVEWSLDREVQDFQSIDIGLYPLIPSSWAAGKSGLKSIQYMAVGIPFVATPLGAAGGVGVDGVTHFGAATAAEWTFALARLIDDPMLRRTMGHAGRHHVLGHYTVKSVSDVMACVLKQVADGSRSSPP